MTFVFVSFNFELWRQHNVSASYWRYLLFKKLALLSKTARFRILHSVNPTQAGIIKFWKILKKNCLPPCFHRPFEGTLALLAISGPKITQVLIFEQYCLLSYQIVFFLYDIHIITWRLLQIFTILHVWYVIPKLFLSWKYPEHFQQFDSF